MASLIECESLFDCWLWPKCRPSDITRPIANLCHMRIILDGLWFHQKFLDWMGLAYLLINGCVQVEHSVFTFISALILVVLAKSHQSNPAGRSSSRLGWRRSQPGESSILVSRSLFLWYLIFRVFDIWKIWYLENFPISRFLSPNTIFIWYLMFHQHTHQTPFQNLYDFNVPPLPVFPLMHQDKNIQIHLIFPWIDFSRWNLESWAWISFRAWPTGGLALGKSNTMLPRPGPSAGSQTLIWTWTRGRDNTMLPVDLVLVTILEKFLSPTVAIISVFETWKSR